MTELYTLLPALFLGAGWTWGVHCLFSEGYLLGGFGKILRKTLPEALAKPLFDCPPCMSSVHGTAIFFMFINLKWYYVIPYVVALAGLNFIIKEYLYPSEE